MATKIGLSELTHRFQSLITGHAELRSEESGQLRRVLDELLPEFREARKKWADGQRKSADDFNLFQVLGVEGDEVRHSKVLAWLLDHRIERGTHAQGDLGFRIFLEELKADLKEGHTKSVAMYADEPNYIVDVEVSGGESRVDIEIAARGKFLIHIENKIHSLEGEDQTSREWRDLQTKRKDLGIPEDACHAIFLTLDGSKARNESFRSISWNRIARVLDNFALEAEPPEVRLFARHCAKAVRKMSVVQLEEPEVENGMVQ
jgi:hypothetical protein